MATKNLEPLSQLLADQKDTLWELLDTHGFAVIDNVLGEEWCTRIRTDIKSLVEKELLEENGTRSSLVILAQEIERVKSGVWGDGDREKTSVGVFVCVCMCVCMCVRV